MCMSDVAEYADVGLSKTWMIETWDKDLPWLSMTDISGQTMPSKTLRSRKKWRSTLRIWNISIFGQVYLVADAGCDECGDVWRMFEKGQDMKCRRQCRITFWIFYCMKSRHVFWMLFMERCASDSCRNIIVVLDGNSRAVVVLCCLQSGFFSFWLMM